MASSWTAVGKSFKPSNALIIAPEREPTIKDEDEHREQSFRKRPNSDSDDEDTIRPKKQLILPADLVKKRDLELAWSIDPYGSQDADILYMMKDLTSLSYQSRPSKLKKRSKHNKAFVLRQFAAGKFDVDSFDIIYQSDPYWRKKTRKALLNPTLSHYRWHQPLHKPSFPVESAYIPVSSLSSTILSLWSNHTTDRTNPDNNNIDSEFLPDSILAAEHVKAFKRLFSVAERERPLDISVSLEHSATLHTIDNLEVIVNGSFIDSLQKIWIGPRKTDRSVLEQKLAILQACLGRVLIAQQEEGNYHHLIKPLQTAIIATLQDLRSQEEVVAYVNTVCSDLPIDFELAAMRIRLHSGNFASSNYQTQLDSFISFSSGVSQAVKNYYAQLSFTHDIFNAAVESQSATFTTAEQQQTSVQQILFFRIDLLSTFIFYLQALGKTEFDVGLIQAQFMLHIWPLMHPDAGFIVASLSRYWEGEHSRLGEEGYLIRSAVNYGEQQSGSSRSQLLAEVFADEDSIFRPPPPDTMMEVEEGPQLPPPSPMQPKQAQEAEKRSDGAQFVYSRLHGYKIWVKPEDASLAYHRILNSLDTVSNANSIKPEESKKKLGYHQNDPSQRAYYHDFLSSKLQHRPLRALNIHDAQAAEEQPERVVFFDELKPLLVSLPTAANNADNSIALIRLMVRLLPALGLHFLHATLSNDTVNDEFKRMNSNLDSDQFQDMFAFCDLAVHGKLGYHSDDHKRRNELLISHLTKAMQVCSVDQEVLDSHKIMLAAQLPGHESRLVFLINMLQSFEVLIPSIAAKSMIRRCLIKLYTEQYLVEKKANASISPEVFQQLCRAIIERSVTVNASQQLHQQQHEAVVGDLTLWSEYLLAELQLFSIDNPEQAFKLADRVLKAVDDQRRSLLQTISSSMVQICGVVELYNMIVTHFLLCDVNDAAMITKAKLILIQLAFSGMIPAGEHNNSVYGSYGGWLKPLSTAGTSSKKKSPAIATVDHNTCVQALQRLQAAAMTQADQLLKQIKQARQDGNRQQLLGLAFISKLDHRPMELLSLFKMAAWLAFLIINEESSFEDALKASDDVLIAAIQLIRDVLLDGLGLSKSAFMLSQHHLQVRKQREMMNLYSIACKGSWLKEDYQDSVSVVKMLSLRELQLQSAAELEAAELLESLHLVRVQLLLALNSCSSAATSINEMIVNAAMQGLYDFPYNKQLLMTFSTMQLTRPGGYRCLRHYFGSFRQEAAIVEYSSIERFYELFAEIIYTLQQYSFTNAACLSAIIEERRSSKIVPDWIMLQYHIHVQLWPEERYHRFNRLCEQALSHPRASDTTWLWRVYLHIHLARGHFEEAKKVALRAIARCGWCKALFMDLLGPLRPGCTEEELVCIERIIEQQGMMLRNL